MSEVFEMKFVNWDLSGLADSAAEEIAEGRQGESVGLLAGLLDNLSMGAIKDIYVLNVLTDCLSGLKRGAVDVYSAARDWANRLTEGPKVSGDSECYHGFCEAISRVAVGHGILRGRFV